MTVTVESVGSDSVGDTESLKSVSSGNFDAVATQMLIGDGKTECPTTRYGRGSMFSFLERDDLNFLPGIHESSHFAYIAGCSYRNLHPGRSSEIAMSTRRH